MIKTSERAGAGGAARRGAAFPVDVAFHIKDAIGEGTEIRSPRLGSALSSRLAVFLHSIPLTTLETFSLSPLFPFILSPIATRGGSSSITETPLRSSPPFAAHPK